MGGLEEGARQAVNVCLGLRKGERVTIIMDRATLEIGKALGRISREATDKVKVFVLEDFGKRPLGGVPGEIEESVKLGGVTILTLRKIGDEIHNLRKPLRILATSHGRYANMPGVTRKVFETGMSTDHRGVWKFSDRVYGILKGSRRIRVRSGNGTNLALEFSPKIRWVDSSGDMRMPGHTGTNLPGAEVYTCPNNASGVFVADVELGDYLTEKYGFLYKTPVRLSIRNGRVVSVKCKNKGLEDELIRYMKTDSDANRVSEFALGTNPFLRDFIGAFIQDEKVPGVHIALGNPYPEVTGAAYSSRVHLDCITSNPTVWVDGKRIMESGRFLI
jgi:aminopeptidase